MPHSLYAHLTLDGPALTLKAVLLDESGKEITNCTSIGGTGGTAVIAWTSESSAVLHLSVTLMGSDKTSREFRLTINEVRPSAPEDATHKDPLFAAGKLLGEAQRLMIAKRYREAMPLLNNVLQGARDLRDERLEGAALYRLGMAHYYLDERQPAIDLLTQALALQRPKQQGFEMALTLNNLAVLKKLVGFCHEALKDEQEALDIRERLNDPRSVAYTLSGMAGSYACLGDAQGALNVTSRALQLWRDQNDLANQADTENTRGVIYIALGEWQQARDELESSRALWRRAANKAGEAEAIYNLGLLESSVDHLQTAETRYQTAFQLMQDAGDKRGLAYALDGLGEVHSRLNMHSKAMRELQQSKTILEELGEKAEEAYVWQALAKEYVFVGAKEAAYSADEKAIALAKQVGDPNSQAVCLYDLAQLESRDGSSKAMTHVDEAIELVETTRENVLDAEHRASYLATKRGIYELKVELLMRTGNVAAAIKASEAAHARSLLDEAAASAGMAQTFVARQQTIDDELRVDRTPAVFARQEHLKEEIRKSDPSHAAFEYPEIADVANIQSLLTERDVLVEYLVGDDKSYGWAISRSAFAAFPMPGRLHLEKSVRTLYLAITARDLHPAGETLHSRAERLAKSRRLVITSATQLSAEILGPIPRSLQKPRILVVADGPLAFVPFTVLPLAANKEIMQLPSASVLRTRGTAQHENSFAPFLIVADPNITSAAFAPLAFSAVEGAQLASLGTRGSVDLRTGIHANSEALLSSNLNRFGLIHISSHAVMDMDHPDDSGILLADGKFDARGIRKLTITARLVTLSACGTAEGKELRGEGLMSLQHAFLYAGAGAVLSTLWPVDDEATSYFMQHFYTALLKKHLGVSGSLRTAQTRMFENPRWKDPYYWAAFTVQGDWR